MFLWHDKYPFVAHKYIINSVDAAKTSNNQSILKFYPFQFKIFKYYIDKIK
jgi:hypothetical protein